MTNLVLIVTTVLASVGHVYPAPKPTEEVIDLLMPKVTPKTPDTYLCNAMKVQEAHKYITGFDPKADAKIAHHVLLYGCEEPGAAPGTVWNCGEMASKGTDYQAGPVCAAGSSIMYAWAMEAPKLKLPTDVGFDVGQDTSVKYLVLQVHYKNVTKFLPPVNGDDSSGIQLETTTQPTKKKAGVYLMGTAGSIAPHTIEYFETACPYIDDLEIVPFAYRTHAHSLGRVISGYRVRDKEWTEIGRKDPRLPEMFYNVTNPGITIKRGDILAARCTMQNDLDHEVYIGATQTDEMCNFYIMYYMNKPAPLAQSQCFSQGPPSWFWGNFPDQDAISIDGVPDTASVIPGTKKPLLRNGKSMYESYADQQPEYNEDDLVDRAVQEMDSDELLNLVRELAAEEEEAEREIALKRRLALQQNYMNKNRW